MSVFNVLQSLPVVTGLAVVAVGTAAFLKSRYTPKTDSSQELSKSILNLENEIIAAQSLGTFSKKTTEYINKYNACQKLLAKLPFEKLITELSILTNIHFLITCPQTFAWHMDSLSADITQAKADNLFAEGKQILIERFFIFQRAALLLNERNNLPADHLDRVQKLYDAIINRAPPQPPVLPQITAAPTTTAPIESPYSRLNCDSEGRAVISELLTELGTKSYWRLLPNAPHLYGLGNKLKAKNVHPLKFIETVFSNTALKGHMKTVYEDSGKKLVFVGGLKDGLEKRQQMGDLEKYLPDFAARMGVTESFITPFFKSQNWDGLLKFFIYR